MSELVKCPQCGHEFNSDETSQWLSDANGHPTEKRNDMEEENTFFISREWINKHCIIIGNIGFILTDDGLIWDIQPVNNNKEK